MNKDELINSGNLEAYLLGELSEEENRVIETMKDTHPEIVEELEKLESSLEYLTKKTAIVPRSNLKLEILNKIQNSKKADIHIRHSLLEFKEKRNYLLVASVSIAIIASVTAIILSIKISDQSKELTDYKDKMNFIQNESYQKNKLAALATNPGLKKVALLDIQKSSTSGSIVYWNNKNGQIYLLLNITQVISENEDFQLWAIVDGKPADAGIIDLSQQVVQEMKTIRGATTFAITIEPKGGSKSPTLDNMIMTGSVSL